MTAQQSSTAGRRLATPLDPHGRLPRKRHLREARPNHPPRRLITEDTQMVHYCTPKLYDLTISSVGNVGPDVLGVPEVAVKVADCPPGKWLDRNRHTMFCTSCKVGRYTNQVNHNLDGFLQDDPCFQCPAGYYQDEVSRSSCKLCAMGQFSDSAESAKCTLCFNGTVYNRNRREWCNGCPKGKVGNIAGLDESQFTECLSCPPGRFQDETYDTYGISILNDTYGVKHTRHSSKHGGHRKEHVGL